MTDQDHDTYEAYLKGTMSPDGIQAFEARLKQDAPFAHAFAEFRAAYDLVNVAGEQRLKSMLAAMHDELHMDGGRIVRMRSTHWLGIAATVCLLLGVAYYFTEGARDPHELYAEHISPYPAPDRTRSDPEAGMDPWAHFADLYAAKDYDDALAELGAVPTDRVQAYLVAFYRGQCQLLKDTPDARAAITSLEAVLATDNDLHAIAHWYIGLAALGSNDIATARSHLKILHDGGTYKREEAQRLLEALPEP